MVFFPLHAAILEPNFDLAFCHTHGMGDFNPPAASQVAIKMKLFLQFQSLVAGVGRPMSLRLTILIYGCGCKKVIEFMYRGSKEA